MPANYSQAAATIRGVLTGAGALNDAGRAGLVAGALARAIAFRLPLPSSPVENLAGYYTMSHDQQVCDIIAGFNEHLIVDVRLVREQTFNFYRLRYDLVYCVQQNEAALSIIAAALPDYFPERIRTMLQDEATRNVSIAPEYYGLWSSLVAGLTVELTNVEKAENVTAVPVGNMMC